MLFSYVFKLKLLESNSKINEILVSITSVYSIMVQCMYLEIVAKFEQYLIAFVNNDLS